MCRLAVAAGGSLSVPETSMCTKLNSCPNQGTLQGETSNGVHILTEHLSNIRAEGSG